MQGNTFGEFELLWDLTESKMGSFLLQMLGYQKEFEMRSIPIPSNSGHSASEVTYLPYLPKHNNICVIYIGQRSYLVVTGSW